MPSCDDVTSHISSVGMINYAVSIESIETLQDSSYDANLEESGKTRVMSYGNYVHRTS